MREQLVVTNVLMAAFLGLQTTPSPPPQDVFRTGIDLIEIDVVVTDGRGEPVRGLTAQDFEVLEDGTPVEIVAFRAVDVPAGPPSGTSAASHVSGTSLASNERELDGRVLVIVLGNFDVQLLPRVRRTVLALVDRLGPNDQIAMFSIGGHSGYQVEFTADKQRVVRAMETRRASGAEDHVLLDVLRRVAVALKPVRGRRKVIVLVGAGGAGLMRSTDIAGDVHNLIPAIRDFEAAAARANVALYAIDPRFAFALDQMALANSPEHRAQHVDTARDQDAGIQTIAATTGGWALVRSNLFEDGVNRLLAESGAYYLIGYRSQAPQDGKFHRITVRVKHLDMQARARTGYMAAIPAAPDAPAPSPLDRLIGAPIPVHGLSLRVVAAPVPARSREGSGVLIVTEVNGAQLEGAGTRTQGRGARCQRAGAPASRSPPHSWQCRPVALAGRVSYPASTCGPGAGDSASRHDGRTARPRAPSSSRSTCPTSLAISCSEAWCSARRVEPASPGRIGCRTTSRSFRSPQRICRPGCCCVPRYHLASVSGTGLGRCGSPQPSRALTGSPVNSSRPFAQPPSSLMAAFFRWTCRHGSCRASIGCWSRHLSAARRAVARSSFASLSDVRTDRP